MSKESGVTSESSKGFLQSLKKFYTEKYKLLLIIPILMLALSLVQIGMQVQSTGDFVKKGVSISGGLTVTVLSEGDYDTNALRSQLLDAHPDHDFTIKRLTEGTQTVGLLIEADIFEKETIEAFVQTLETTLGMSQDLFNVETTGPSLGDSFFKSTLKALLLAFVFMGIVVFLYFRTFIPSVAVMVAAFSDMVVTLAVINLMGMRISTAGIVAFLLLIGYSVDTDILLTVRVLKHKEGHYMQRIFESIKTGLTMNFSTLAAVSVALLFTSSEVISQIMTILLIGLIVDMVNTWIQNVAILRLYLERKEK